MNCIRCNHEHNGAPMRTHPRSRFRPMLKDEAMPRDERGNYLLCTHCQRWVCWYGGMVPFLAREVAREAKHLMNVRARERKAA